MTGITRREAIQRMGGGLFLLFANPVSLINLTGTPIGETIGAIDHSHPSINSDGEAFGIVEFGVSSRATAFVTCELMVLRRGQYEGAIEVQNMPPHGSFYRNFAPHEVPLIPPGDQCCLNLFVGGVPETELAVAWSDGLPMYANGRGRYRSCMATSPSLDAYITICGQ